MDLLGLPYEKLLEIALYLPIKDILSFCKTNRYLRELCDDEFFWQQKLKQFGLNINTKNLDMNNKILVVLFEKMMNKIGLHAEDIGILVQSFRETINFLPSDKYKDYSDEELVKYLIEIYNGIDEPIWKIFKTHDDLFTCIDYNEFFEFIVESLPHRDDSIYPVLINKTIVEGKRYEFEFIMEKHRNFISDRDKNLYAYGIGFTGLRGDFLDPLLEGINESRKRSLNKSYNEGRNVYFGN
jgi:F-box domain.